MITFVGVCEFKYECILMECVNMNPFLFMSVCMCEYECTLWCAYVLSNMHYFKGK